MSRALDDLHPVFRPIAFEFLARLAEKRIMVAIVDTLRTAEEHQENLRKGVSWTARSLHLYGLAIDVAPIEIYRLHGGNKIQWNADDPVWHDVGEVGESVGMDWGGRWKNHPDPGHFEHARGRRLAGIMG